MPTIEDNIKAMANLVATVKKDTHLTENTVLRIVDMNFALAQGAGLNSMGGSEEIPMPTGDNDVDLDSGIREQVVAFPTNGIDEDEVLATTDHEPTREN